MAVPRWSGVEQSIGWGGAWHIAALECMGEGAGPKIFARPLTFSAWFHDDGTVNRVS